MLALLGWDGEDRAGRKQRVGEAVPPEEQCGFRDRSERFDARPVGDGVRDRAHELTDGTIVERAQQPRVRLFLARAAEHEEADERGDEEVVTRKYQRE